MIIRHFRPSDVDVLRELHGKQGHPYDFPDLEGRDFVAILVVVDENDRPVQAVAARKTVECFMLGDPAWRTPAWRLEAMEGLHRKMWLELVLQGFTDAHAWLPPSVVKAFGKRLTRKFGWVQSQWQSFCKYLV